MDASRESIEVGLDSQADQITIIVVGVDNRMIESVIVLQSEFSKKKRRLLWNRNKEQSTSSWFPTSMSSRQSFTCPGNDSKPASSRSLRSELLRPISPISTRSSMFGGERGERDCSGSVRGRDSTRERDDRSVSHSSRHSRQRASMSHSRHGSTNDSRHGRQRHVIEHLHIIEKRQPTKPKGFRKAKAATNTIPRYPSFSSTITMDSMVPTKKARKTFSTRKSRREEKKKQPVIKLDTQGYHNLPPMQEKMAPRTKNEKDEKYLKSSRFRNPLYRPHRLIL